MHGEQTNQTRRVVANQHMRLPCQQSAVPMVANVRRRAGRRGEPCQGQGNGLLLLYLSVRITHALSEPHEPLSTTRFDTRHYTGEAVAGGRANRTGDRRAGNRLVIVLLVLLLIVILILLAGLVLRLLLLALLLLGLLGALGAALGRGRGGRGASLALLELLVRGLLLQVPLLVLRRLRLILGALGLGSSPSTAGRGSGRPGRTGRPGGRSSPAGGGRC